MVVKEDTIVNKEMKKDELVKWSKHIYTGGETDWSLVSHKNHAFSFWGFALLFISPTLINECT